jgi:hypothetical protein
MQRNETERRHESRRQGENPMQHSIAAEELADDSSAVPETNPSAFLTARELEAWDPATSPDRRMSASDRRGFPDARRVRMPDE